MSLGFQPKHRRVTKLHPVIVSAIRGDWGGLLGPGSVDGQAAERERGYLTGLWKKRGRKPILPPSFLPPFLSLVPFHVVVVVLSSSPGRNSNYFHGLLHRPLPLPPSSSSSSPCVAHWVAIFQLSVLTHFASSCRRPISLVRLSVRKTRHPDDVRLIHHYFHPARP